MTHSRRTPWSDLGSFWTIPNVLTLMRLVLILPITYLILVDGSLVWITMLVVTALATDYFDGRLARWSHTVSDWGKVLDPLVDKLGAAMVVMALTMRGSLPEWFFFAIVARDFIIFAGGVIIRARTGQIVMSLMSGKIAVTGISLTVLAALLQADPPVMQFCIWGTSFLLAWSLFRYIVRFTFLVRHAPDSNDN